MTAESVFPKIDGDILYASEVNRMNYKNIGFVSQFVATDGSGTAFGNQGGSINYVGTGSLGIKDFMVIQTDVTLNGNAGVGGNYAARLVISGTAGLNNMVLSTKSNTATMTSVASFEHLLTSGTMTASGGNIGSNYNIRLQIQTDNPNGNSIAFSDLLVWGI